jgi:hypothetical protein
VRRDILRTSVISVGVKRSWMGSVRTGVGMWDIGGGWEVFSGIDEAKQSLVV